MVIARRERYECLDEEIEADSYYGWKIDCDSISIEIYHEGASYGMYFDDYDELTIELQSILMDTRSIIREVMEKDLQKHEKLSLF